jgi:hypothetical protein
VQITKQNYLHARLVHRLENVIKNYQEKILEQRREQEELYRTNYYLHLFDTEFYGEETDEEYHPISDSSDEELVELDEESDVGVTM